MNKSQDRILHLDPTDPAQLAAILAQRITRVVNVMNNRIDIEKIPIKPDDRRMGLVLNKAINDWNTLSADAVEYNTGDPTSPDHQALRIDLLKRINEIAENVKPILRKYEQ